MIFDQMDKKLKLFINDDKLTSFNPLEITSDHNMIKLNYFY